MIQPPRFINYSHLLREMITNLTFVYIVGGFWDIEKG
jgi:hypothetical protein